MPLASVPAFAMNTPAAPSGGVPTVSSRLTETRIVDGDTFNSGGLFQLGRQRSKSPSVRIVPPQPTHPSQLTIPTPGVSHQKPPEHRHPQQHKQQSSTVVRENPMYMRDLHSSGSWAMHSGLKDTTTSNTHQNHHHAPEQSSNKSAARNKRRIAPIDEETLREGVGVMAWSSDKPVVGTPPPLPPPDSENNNSTSTNVFGVREMSIPFFLSHLDILSSFLMSSTHLIPCTIVNQTSIVHSFT